MIDRLRKKLLDGLFAAAALGLVVVHGACAAPSDDEGTSEESIATEQAIKGGTATCEQPAVGRVCSNGGCCTASLVAPNVILTAAHCFDGPLVQQGPSLATFYVNAGCANVRPFKAVRLRRWAKKDGKFAIRTNDDIAVAQLSEAVPSSLARPLPIADDNPRRGDALTWYGYGRRDSAFCAVRPDSDGKKSVYRGLRYPDRAFRACPGDSGGPLIASNGAIIRVVSNGIFWGNVVQHAASVRAQVAAWTASGSTDAGGARDAGATSASDAGREAAAPPRDASVGDDDAGDETVDDAESVADADTAEIEEEQQPTRASGRRTTARSLRRRRLRARTRTQRAARLRRLARAPARRSASLPAPSSRSRCREGAGAASVAAERRALQRRSLTWPRRRPAMEVSTARTWPRRSERRSPRDGRWTAVSKPRRCFRRELAALEPGVTRVFDRAAARRLEGLPRARGRARGRRGSGRALAHRLLARWASALAGRARRRPGRRSARGVRPARPGQTDRRARRPTFGVHAVAMCRRCG